MSEVPAGNVCMHKDIQQSCRGARCKKGSCSQDKVPKRQPVGKGLGTPAELVPTEAVAVEFHACSTFPLLLHIAGFAAYLAYAKQFQELCLKHNELSLSEWVYCVQIIQYNITLLPSVNTLIARGMFCGAKYTHHTFTPIIKHLKHLICQSLPSQHN